MLSQHAYGTFQRAQFSLLQDLTYSTSPEDQKIRIKFFSNFGSSFLSDMKFSKRMCHYLLENVRK